ncbi:MAG TPA: FAD-dependent oxidoreductase, partial [Candidatus Methylacidiphilales bacterium]
MQQHAPESRRTLPTQALSADFVVVGGGVAGVCAAVAAARHGASVILVQDRPVLGGNASSEVRLWMNGATSHGYNNNRWARESGVMNEIMMLNVYRNPGGNAVILDTIFLDLILAEPNITLLLNTAVYAADKKDADTVSSVRAFNSQNETFYEIAAPLFCDASGDGIVGFLAGAAFRIGAEGREEFDEAFAPDKAFGELLGHSIYFYTKDAGRPVPCVAPSYALRDIEKAIPRYRYFKPQEDGCYLWWIEFGGRLDTVFDTEKIKWELWRVVYGVWNYFKNSGKFPEAANLTLEWAGTIPGKRESRRFEGDFMLSQRDVIEQRRHDDDVAYGGWALDLHPADGVYSDRPGCTHYHAKGPYPVPYRTMYSRNLRNLFLAGRVMSCSHVAFGSLRNMASLGYCAQAAGTAAAICAREKLLPADLGGGDRLKSLQRALLRDGQHIRGLRHEDPADLALRARARASSEFVLRELPADGDWLRLNQSAAQLVPLPAGPVPGAAFRVRARKATTLKVRFLTSLRADNHTPEKVHSEAVHEFKAGEEKEIGIACPEPLAEAQYGYYTLLANEEIEVRCSSRRVTGLLTVFQYGAQRETNHLGVVKQAGEIGVEAFELWSPRRRP